MKKINQSTEAKRRRNFWSNERKDWKKNEWKHRTLDTNFDRRKLKWIPPTSHTTKTLASKPLPSLPTKTLAAKLTSKPSPSILTKTLAAELPFKPPPSLPTKTLAAELTLKPSLSLLQRL